MSRREEGAGVARPRPESTYRIQLHAGFTFRDATAIVPYLRDLGVTHVYASPYLKARPGSTHGYDIVDHRQLNPEIGSREEFDRWVAALNEAGLKQMLDTVPNHMGVATRDNPWWNDVLENGPASRFANHFDISWHSSDRDDLRDRVLLPVLGDNYGEVLESGQLRLAFENGAFEIEYFQHRFPVAPRSYARILEAEGLAERLDAESSDYSEFQSILTAIGHLPDRTETEPARVSERLREKEVVKRRLGELASRSEPVRRFIDETVTRINGKPGDPRSFDRLDDLLRHQCHRLAHWRVATDEINYRRFFDVNELAALSMEREEVFRDAHELILELVASGAVDALRIDHPDGLYAPAAYLDRLQNGFLMAVARREGGPDSGDESERASALRIATPKPLCVIVEKILGAKESLPPDWPVDGTSGYEFINEVNGLFVDPAGQRGLTTAYRDFVEDYTGWHEAAYRAKRAILRSSMASELHTLSRQLEEIARKGRRSRDFTLNALRIALAEVIACFPVYRTYIAESGGVTTTDREVIETAIRRASNRNPLIGAPIFDFIRRVLLLEQLDGGEAGEQRRFAGKFQQVTSPVMAKGVEDTAFYRYVRLASLNEVGGDPSRFGRSPESVHQFNSGRQANGPHGLSPLSTHDTKRGEDVRARLNVLSELPDEWGEAIRAWAELNAVHKTALADGPAPDRNDEYLLYQTLLGAWPLEPYSANEYRDFTERVQRYVQKATHEAKVHSSWINPNAEYDAAAREFVHRILDPETGRAFLEAFRPFQRRISRVGLFSSLAQTVLKLTLPGVADTYQGTELWDFSLVDPDNRRPVDYARRQALLAEMRAEPAVTEGVGNMADGRIKLFVTQRILNLRRERPGLFTSGHYVPIPVKGAAADHAFAFLRRNGTDAVLVVIPRMLARLCPGEQDVPLGNAWGDSHLETDGIGEWSDVLTRARHPSGALRLADLFRHCPVVVLQQQLS